MKFVPISVGQFDFLLLFCKESLYIVRINFCLPIYFITFPG